MSKNNYFKYEDFELIGGKQFSSKDFNESDWTETLEDFSDDPISTFRLSPDDLRKQILLLVGKKNQMHNEDYIYKLSEPGSYEIIELPENVLEILQRS